MFNLKYYILTPLWQSSRIFGSATSQLEILCRYFHFLLFKHFEGQGFVQFSKCIAGISCLSTDTSSFTWFNIKLVTQTQFFPNHPILMTKILFQVICILPSIHYFLCRKEQIYPNWFYSVRRYDGLGAHHHSVGINPYVYSHIDHNFLLFHQTKELASHSSLKEKDIKNYIKNL